MPGKAQNGVPKGADGCVDARREQGAHQERRLFMCDLSIVGGRINCRAETGIGQRLASALVRDPGDHSRRIGHGIAPQGVIGSQCVEDHGRVLQQVLPTLFIESDRIREYFQRVGPGQMRNGIEGPFPDKLLDQRIRFGLESLTQSGDHLCGHRLCHDGPCAIVIGRVHLQNDAGWPPRFLRLEIRQSDASR